MVVDTVVDMGVDMAVGMEEVMRGAEVTEAAVTEAVMDKDGAMAGTEEV